VNDVAGQFETEPGPSWARPNWPVSELDEINLGLDPTQATIESFKKAATAKAAATSSDPEAIRKAAEDSIRAMMLIRTYRVRGHLAAKLDPLGLHHSELPPDLTPAYHGFSDADLDRPIWLGGVLGFERATIREIVKCLQANYCGTIGVEYMHINDVEERRFIQSRIEGKGEAIHFTPEGKKAILAKVIEGEQWEKFLARKYVGTKRFGLDGGESAVPALEAVIKYGGQYGVEEIDIGMSHRGRLNILSNVMGKPYRAIFHEFAGGATNPADVGGSGDVKYHLGTSSDREFDGNKVHLSLLPNPSHLEAVDPVVLGKARAVMTCKDDKHGKKVLPILLHGDAAFAGQGVVAECLGFSGLPGYGTGGTIHFIINNQIGFTTSPQFARSSPYPTDIAKAVQAPILHVNADDPEAVTFCCKLAIEFRQTFGRDIVIDMWCYRRFGHNEGDEPSFTQPQMYSAIRNQPPISEIYGKRLIEEGVVDQQWIDQHTQAYVAHLNDEFEAGTSYLPNKADWFEGRWTGLGKPNEPVLGRRNTATAVPEEELRKVGEVLTTIPEGLHIHKTLGRVLDAKREMFETGEGFDWATAEALAFGTLLAEGHNVRLSGQDSGRGTFSQRHAVWVDQESGAKHIPLCHIASDSGGGRFEVRDSPLSEFGVLGFEYGYSLADPHTLVCWEAQFGDFANGAQTIIDQFIASGEAKWLRASGLVLLLPHGFEGQGPEHSSARLERYLQLCAEDNLQVANCTTPANYFHILRRQLLREFRKPLILMTPKSLLRNKHAVSSLADFSGESHFRRIVSDLNPPAETRRLVLCTGKLGYELMDARDEAGDKQTEVVRIEQLYPFPSEPLVVRLQKMPKLEELVWAQEEPQNNGAWTFVEPLLECCLDEAGFKGMRPRYAGRAASASPATGLAKRHASEQASLIADALGHSSPAKQRAAAGR
jgi:2-oxoglutarate dehydrogenase E1 component